MVSPNISTASKVLKMGIKLPNKTVLPAPNLPIAKFQHQNAKTEVPIPKYKIDPAKEYDQSVDFSFKNCSAKKKGNNIMVPKTNSINKKLKALIFVGFFRTRILYTAKANAPANIHASPLENLKDCKISQLPFEINKKMPRIQTVIPIILKKPSLSFKKITAMMVAKMGEEVVPIKAILIAVVLCPATYTKVLNKAIPVNAIRLNIFQLGFMNSHSNKTFWYTKGNNTIDAQAHR